MKQKIAILHDAFLYRGGGERLVTLMAKSLGADLVSGFFSEGSFDPRELGYTGKIIPLGKPVFAKGLRHEILRWRFLHRTQFLSEYDTVIFSGNCLEASVKLPEKVKKIYYCHTPPRYIFDLRDQYLARIPRFLHGIANMILDQKAEKYKKLLANMDVIITNSETVQKRLQDFTGYESEIIYPPTDTSRFFPSSRHREEGSDPVFGSQSMDCFVPRNDGTKESKDYFLSWARLSPPKRVDLIVDAFLEMPEENLIFTYGKNDPMKDAILAKIRDYKNITAIESPDDDTLISLIQGARASIYIPVEEDFGMSPVESMACGVPVIGADEGGLRETIIDGETGFLTRVSVENIKKAVQKMTPELSGSFRERCQSRAGEFSLEKFVEKLRLLLAL